MGWIHHQHSFIATLAYLCTPGDHVIFGGYRMIYHNVWYDTALNPSPGMYIGVLNPPEAIGDDK